MKRKNRYLIPVAAIALAAAGCDGGVSSGYPGLDIPVGGVTLWLYARSIREFQLAYEANWRNDESRFLFSNFDCLESSSTLYQYRVLGGRYDGRDFFIDGPYGDSGYFDAWCTVYDEDIHPLYTIHIGFEPYYGSGPSALEEIHPQYVEFEGPIEYSLIQDAENINTDTISYQSNAPTEYTLEFSTEDGTDIYNYADMIEEQVDILSRNYVIMTDGMTRYIDIPDSSSEEEVEA